MSGFHSGVVGVKSITKHPCHRVAEKQECDIADLQGGKMIDSGCALFGIKRHWLRTIPGQRGKLFGQRELEMHSLSGSQQAFLTARLVLFLNN